MRCDWTELPNVDACVLSLAQEHVSNTSPFQLVMQSAVTKYIESPPYLKLIKSCSLMAT